MDPRATKKTRSNLPPEAWFTTFEWSIRWAAEEFLTGYPAHFSAERERKRAVLLSGISSAFERNIRSMGRMLVTGAREIREKGGR